jgi:DNA-binding XRE family transcriptional regulator
LGVENEDESECENNACQDRLRLFHKFVWFFPKPATHATNVASVVKPASLYGFNVSSNKKHEAVCSHVARLLKQEREKRGLSLNLLAEKSGLSRQTVSFIEQELRTPNLDTLLRITSALEINLEKIIAQARKQAKDK